MDSQPVSEVQETPKPRSRPQKTVKTAPSFNLPEKLFILSIDDDKGAIAASVKDALRFGLAGAVLADLALSGRIQLEGERVKPVETAPTGDPVFDHVLTLLAAEKKLHKPGRWVKEIGSRLIVKQVATRLAERGVIAIEKKRYSWISPNLTYPQLDVSVKYSIKSHLRAVVLAGEKSQAGDIALLSLLKACRMLGLVFTRDERKAAEKKVAALVKDEVFGEAVSRLIAEIDAAMTAAVTAATTS